MARSLSSATRTVAPFALRCEYLADPIGISESRPRLSWKLRSTETAETPRGLSQRAYQVRVASSREKLKAGQADLWDSRKVKSNETVFVEYDGKALASGQRAWWSVVVWDQNGRASAESEIAFWEMGLLAPGEWRGLWIGSQLVGGPKTEAAVPFLRKNFRLPDAKGGKKIVSARLYATALGLYEFRLNGKKVGDYVFPPFWTDYRKRVQYQAYDVTEMLKPGGENAIGVILGDGWYCGYTGNIGRRQFYGDRPKALAQIVVRFADGTSETIATDGSWTTASGPILASDMMMGESYDARREMPGWDKPAFKEDARWTRATVFDNPHPGMAIVAMSGPPVRAVKELKPVEVKKVAKPWDMFAYLFDFGQNMVGRVRLKVKGPAGTTITMRFAEVLDENGKLYTTNLRAAKQTDSYTLKGDPAGEVYESRFTFHGFRYVEVPVYPGEAAADALTGIVLHSDMEQTGSFECSDPLVNQLQHNIEWGQRGNFVDVPTDCPQRDERLGWTGDAQVFVRTAAFNFDVSGFFAKWTQDLRDSQSAAGTYPNYAPNNVVPKSEATSSFDGGPAWSDAGVICPWTILQCYGDRRLIARHYDSMARFVDRMVASAEKFGMIRSHPDWNGWLGFGDWLAQDGGHGYFGATPKDLIGTAFLAYDAKLLAGMAKMLRKNRDAARFTKIAETATEAFRRRFVTEDGLLAGHTQTSYVLALHFDLLPAKLRAAAADLLIKNIRANGNRLNTGFVGSPYLNHVLTAAGRLDVAYELLMQKNWPSWLYPVAHGATTIWERWDGWTHDKGFQNPEMNSFNHYAYGAVGSWLYQVVAGIEIDPRKPGYQHVIFRPHPKAGGPLTHAKASLETLHGRVESAWRIDAGKIRYELLVPPNVTATAHLPAQGTVTESGGPAGRARGVKVQRGERGIAVYELESGRYVFEAAIQ